MACTQINVQSLKCVIEMRNVFKIHIRVIKCFPSWLPNSTHYLFFFKFNWPCFVLTPTLQSLEIQQISIIFYLCKWVLVLRQQLVLVLILHNNPFSFNNFMLHISICLWLPTSCANSFTSFIAFFYHNNTSKLLSSLHSF